MTATLDGLVVEIFAGPGGFSEGARACGITNVHGIEWDEQACATARAAGHHRIHADVAAYDPTLFGYVWGLIGSPPCQSFSSAGKQLGKLDRPRIEAHVAAIKSAGHWIDYDREGWHDPRSPLVLEPLRYALTLMPEWIALEQVPAVLPLWQAFAAVLADHGYSTDTGVLSAEQYGVPQTRQRAILVASRTKAAKLPEPTHRKYRKGEDEAEGLFDVLLPWVSMAEALGWAHGGTVGFPRLADAGERITLDGIDYRARDLRSTDEPAPTITAGHDRAERVWEPAEAYAEGEPVAARFGNQEHSAVREADEPAATVRYSERANACDWLPTQHVPRSATFGERPGRAADEPSFTITGSGNNGGGAHHAPEWRFPEQSDCDCLNPNGEPGPHHARACSMWEPYPAEAMHGAGATCTTVDPREPDQPSQTITGKGTASWVGVRPATTVQGDSRIWPPGHKVNGDDRERLGEAEANERYGDRAGTKAVRVSVQEAGILQSFPPDYPWQGSKTAQYRQVGDAVPPLLARAVIAPLVSA